jgi:hypothetical protein
MVDKNQAVIDFLLSCPQISSNPVFFNAINARDNDKQIVTQTNDVSLDSKYIDGSVLKRYTFTIIDFRSVIYQPLPKVEGYSSENVDEMFDVQSLMDWVNEQADLQNYPDFGEDCFIDSMKTTADNPNLNGIDTNVTPALAKYSVSIQIDYLDTSKAVWKS